MSGEQRIGGFPVSFTEVRVAGHVVELATVENLEAHLDRDRLLGDSAYEPPYWALVWSGARLFLPGFLGRHDVAGSRILDVGCGLGVVSLVLAAAGAQVTALDRAGPALEFVSRSIERNQLPVETCAMDLADLSSARRFDHVIAAELLYEREGFPALAEDLIERVSSGGGLTVVDAHRIDTAAFYKEVERVGGRRVFSERIDVREEQTLVRIDVSEFVRD
jgi:2-polyprenyl-3-methyl-5-hydroxy-6-metoxy-1,4-benzoquinol methylase